MTFAIELSSHPAVSSVLKCDDETDSEYYERYEEAKGKIFFRAGLLDVVARRTKAFQSPWVDSSEGQRREIAVLLDICRETILKEIHLEQ